MINPFKCRCFSLLYVFFKTKGFMSPTDGTAYINGYDIRTDLDRVRQTLGLCPQHNILFDTMTVQEHLMFYGRVSFPKNKSLSQIAMCFIS